jgi:SAM-dependent methyltransferase
LAGGNMKFETTDKRYLTNRKQFSEKFGNRELWSIMDQWPLYVGIGNLSRCMAISDLLRSTLDVPGHIVEFGSWKGANLMFMAKLMHIYDPHGCKQIHCFESFEGLKTFADKDGCTNITEINGGIYQGNYHELIDLIELYELQDDIIIHVGDILETLPVVLDDKSLNFSFVYCDTDLYKPTISILESIHSRLSKGGLFIMDEWNYGRWQGESIAVREFLDKHDNYEMIHVRNTRQPSLVLKKIKKI